MLYLLDGMVSQCTKCDLYKNGRAKPYWTEKSEYMIVGEAPGGDEVDRNEPFVGKAGSVLWSVMEEQGFRKEQFLIINTVNCRPVDGKKNGKPTPEQSLQCKEWLRKYFSVLQPLKIMLLGSYAVKAVLNLDMSIVANNGTVESIWLDNKFPHVAVPAIISVHPAYTIYAKEKGMELLRESVKTLKYKPWGK